MANKHMRRWSTLIIIREMQIKTAVRYHLTQIRMAIIKKIHKQSMLERVWRKGTLLHCSVQFSCSVMSSSLPPHESQHARPPCPSPTPGVHSDSRPLSQWCHPAISSSVIPFSCPQSLPASESVPMSQLLAWGGQSTGVSASASFLPKKSQGWYPSLLVGK